MDRAKKKVLKYTINEGGLWLSWPYGSVEKSQLRKRHKTSVLISGEDGSAGTVHSLLFEDGKEWDCVNGMRN